MFVYNVTCHVEENILDDWLQWMKEEHLPEVMATGKFLSYRMLKVDPLDGNDTGHSFAIQYTATSREKYLLYVAEDGPGLKAKTVARYGDFVMAFRTTMELIGES